MELHKDEININRYANGELSGEALKAFEALLEKDKALQEKVKSHEFMDAVLFKNIDKEDQPDDEQMILKPLLNKFGDKYFLEEESKKTIHEPTKTTSKPNNIRRLFTFSAIAVAAAAILLFFFTPNQENKLYTQYFEPPTMDVQLGKPAISSTFDKATKAYQSKNYNEAVSLYDQFLKENPNNSIALLNKGSAELALDQDATALKTFQRLADNHPKYIDIANWYLALCYLKKGDKAQTKTILKRISTDDKEYYSKAQQLLKEL